MTRQILTFLFYAVACCGLIESAQGADEAKLWQTVEPKGPVGVCSLDSWKKDFPGCTYEDGISDGRLAVVNSGDDRAWRVTCKANKVGPDLGGVGWRWPFAKIKSESPPKNRAELRYTVRFEEGFQFVKGGKLPGLCGGPKTITGGDLCTGYDGWSARIMWRRDGRGQAYVYHPRMKGKYGDEFDFPDDFRFPINQPVQLRIDVEMNSNNASDGVLRVWVQSPDQPEKLVVEKLDMEWTKTTTIGVDSLLFNVFHGGSDSSWAPTKDSMLTIGEIAYR